MSEMKSEDEIPENTSEIMDHSFCVPRPAPVPISSSASNGFYVGTVRDPRRYSLFMMIKNNEKKALATRSPTRTTSSSSSSTPEKSFKEELEELQKENCYDQEFTTFFFDEEMHLLANETARSDRRHSPMSYEKLGSPIMEDDPIENYEDLVPGRHRRSGNERVHPNNLHTAFSRSRKKLDRELPSSIELDPNGKNDDLSYWQDRINRVYQHSGRRNIRCDSSSRKDRTSCLEAVHSETEHESCCGDSGPSNQEELLDINNEIFGFSDTESESD